VSGQFHAPAALPPGKEPPVAIGWEVRRTPVPVWATWRNENSCPHLDSISDPLAVQPVTSRYADCAILAPQNCSQSLFNLKWHKNYINCYMFRPWPSSGNCWLFENRHTALDLKSMYFCAIALLLFTLKCVCLRIKTLSMLCYFPFHISVPIVCVFLLIWHVRLFGYFSPGHCLTLGERMLYTGLHSKVVH
jgi:hypothetical protein